MDEQRLIDIIRRYVAQEPAPVSKRQDELSGEVESRIESVVSKVSELVRSEVESIDVSISSDRLNEEFERYSARWMLEFENRFSSMLEGMKAPELDQSEIDGKIKSAAESLEVKAT